MPPPNVLHPQKSFRGRMAHLSLPRFLFRKLLHFRGTKKQMSAELARQKADEHLCVAFYRKVRIRLHPSIEHNCGTASRN